MFYPNNHRELTRALWRQRPYCSMAITLRKQNGVALITVLMLLVFLAALAIYAAESQNLVIRKVSNMRESEQAFQIATGGEQWAIKLLEKDMSADTLPANPDYDHLSEFWANLGPVVKVEGTESFMQVMLFDEHAKFNLNNLIQGKSVPPSANVVPNQQSVPVPQPVPQPAPVTVPSWYEIFQLLLLSLDLDPELADVVIDWIDANSDTTGTTGAEDRFYTNEKNSRLTSNSPLVVLSELSELKGFTTEVINALGPFVSTLPVNGNDFTKINVNTAPMEILAALATEPTVSPGDLEELQQLRIANPFQSVEDFMQAYQNNTPYSLKQGVEALLDIKGEYFSSRSCAESGRVKLSQISLLHKNRTDQNVTVQHRQSDYNCPELTPEPESESEAESDN